MKPHEAVAKCDIRLVAAQDTADILRKVEAHVHHHAPEVTFVANGPGMQPAKTPMTSRYAASVRQALFAAQTLSASSIRPVQCVRGTPSGSRGSA